MTKEETAYEEGRQAFISGVDNPYDVDTEYSCWEAWYDGNGDARRSHTGYSKGECAA